MEKGTYFYVFILVMAGIFGTVMGLIPIKGEIPIKAELPKEQYIKVRRTLNGFLWVMRILKFCFLLIAIWIALIPFILDIPHIVMNDYPIVSGTVVKEVSDARSTSISVKDDKTGKVIRIRLLGEGVEESDEVEIIYFPHLKVGNVVR